MSNRVLEVGRIVFGPLITPKPVFFPSLAEWSCMKCGRIWRGTKPLPYCHECACKIALKHESIDAK